MALKTPTLSVEETRKLAGHTPRVKRIIPPSTAQTLTSMEQTSPKKNGQSPKQVPIPIQSTSSAPKVRYTIDAPIPARGHYPAFDKAAEQFGTGDAFRRILKLAYLQFDAELLAGKISSPINSYKTSPEMLSTSKTVSAEINKTLLSRYNSSGLLNNSEIGRQYAAEAFLFYIESQ